MRGSARRAVAAPASIASSARSKSSQARDCTSGRSPDVQSLAWDDFDRAEEAIEAGAATARRALPRIQKLLGRKDTSSQEREARLEAEDQGYLWLAEAIR